MCGIVGIISHQPVAEALYDSLIHLQHRGQDAAGILTCQQRFDYVNGKGLVQEIFNKENIQTLKGNLGIAHTRYPTAGSSNLSDIQPIWVGSPRGIALAHNGHLVNYQEVADYLSIHKKRHLNSSMDSEVLLHLLAEGLEVHNQVGGMDEAFFDILCDVILSISETVKGAYSIVSVILGKGILAYRDPHGIRPLVTGEKINEQGQKACIFASENTMFSSLGFKATGDLQNGELVFVNLQGKMFRKVLTNKPFRPCIFEYVYFARPDATLDAVNVYRSRMRMGQNLAKQWKEKYPNLLPDVIIPIPFSANTAAIVMAKELGVLYSEGLYKNPFIGRTFIMSDNKKRSQQLRYKLSPQRIEIQNKKVLLVDDSIVRGNTSLEIVKMIRENDPKAVYFASACPPIRHPCFYGIDLPSDKELIAANFYEESIRRHLNVDVLLYQTQKALVEAVTRKGEHGIEIPCMACMNGKYITGNVCIKEAFSSKETYLNPLEVV